MTHVADQTNGVSSVAIEAPVVAFEITTASGRKFVVHAQSEAQARERFESAVAAGGEAWTGKTGEGAKRLIEFGEVVSVALEPAVKTTIQEGPTWRGGT